MKRAPARIALPILVASLASTLAGCKLPYEIAKKYYGPNATPTATPLPAKEIQAVFSQISDDRVSGEGDTAKASISVDLPGTKRSEVAAARVFTRKAVDDLGTDLVPEKAAEAQFESVYFDASSVYGDVVPPVPVSVPMKNASRKAKLLKEVVAEVELYSPSLDPASLVTIPRFLAEAGKPVVSQALKDAGVEVVVLSPAQIEAERKAWGEKKRAEAKKMGLDGEMLEMTVNMAVESFLASSWVNAYLKVTDPNGRVHDYVYLNPAGETQSVNRGEESGYVTLGAQGEEPGPDWGLQVRLRTPKVFQRYTFTLRDVALP